MTAEELQLIDQEIFTIQQKQAIHKEKKHLLSIMDTECRSNRITNFSKRPSGKKRFVMNTRITVAMTQNTEYVPKRTQTM
ncbi:unnamed protein product [Porites evermanni]|uniref:Uncharacterized protein n=1 Tax=Porites evermanni TaxID=104178 RepID=A0ABN8RDK2_9CNID|nr:unnamed protein product [Porites evermanni]